MVGVCIFSLLIPISCLESNLGFIICYPDSIDFFRMTNYASNINLTYVLHLVYENFHDINTYTEDYAQHFGHIDQQLHHHIYNCGEDIKRPFSIMNDENHDNILSLNSKNKLVNYALLGEITNDLKFWKYITYSCKTYLRMENTGSQFELIIAALDQVPNSVKSKSIFTLWTTERVTRNGFVQKTIWNNQNAGNIPSKSTLKTVMILLISCLTEILVWIETMMRIFIVLVMIILIITHFEAKIISRSRINYFSEILYSLIGNLSHRQKHIIWNALICLAIPDTSSAISVTFLRRVDRFQNDSMIDYYYSCQVEGTTLQWKANNDSAGGYFAENVGDVKITSIESFHITSTLISAIPLNLENTLFVSILVASGRHKSFLEVGCTNNNEIVYKNNVNELTYASISNRLMFSPKQDILLDYIVSAPVIPNSGEWTHIFMCGSSSLSQGFAAGDIALGFDSDDQVGRWRNVFNANNNQVIFQAILIEKDMHQTTSLLIVSKSCFFNITCAVGNSAVRRQALSSHFPLNIVSSSALSGFINLEPTITLSYSESPETTVDGSTPAVRNSARLNIIIVPVIVIVIGIIGIGIIVYIIIYRRIAVLRKLKNQEFSELRDQTTAVNLLSTLDTGSKSRVESSTTEKSVQAKGECTTTNEDELRIAAIEKNDEQQDDKADLKLFQKLQDQVITTDLLSSVRRRYVGECKTEAIQNSLDTKEISDDSSFN